MKMYKRIASLMVAGIAAVAMVQAQATTSKPDDQKKELSVEESYLQESIEAMVIREQTRADSRDMKFVALDYIQDAIKGGRAGEDVQKALDYLAVEGTINQAREGGLGRLVNNYPDVRKRAAEYLGDLGGKPAHDTLVKMVLAEPEPMVLTEAIKSLGKIGLNDNDETTSTISWIVSRFDVLNPDNALALAALDAFEKIAAANGGIKDPAAIRTVIKIAEGNYIRPVQAKAKDTLKKLRGYSGKDSSKK